MGTSPKLKPLVWVGSSKADLMRRFSDAIFVLHVFQKKAKRGIATPKTDIDLIKTRLKAAREIAGGMR